SIECTLRRRTRSDQQHNVGLVYGRSEFTYAAVIAIMRSGNVYVPLNRKTPTGRLVGILADACIDTVVLDAADPVPQSVLDALREVGGLTIVTTEGDWFRAVEAAISRSGLQQLSAGRVAEGVANIAGIDSSHAASERHPGHLAYIIYTSGSTGEPKGVAITHVS